MKGNSSDIQIFLTNSTISTNEMLETYQDDKPINVFFAIFIPTLCFLITIGNLGTIIAFWKLPSLRNKPSELLILSLSCADFITGFIVIPFFSPVYITPGYWPFKEITCMIFNFFMDLAVHASLFTLCMISIDRFLLVSKEYPQYMKIQTHFRIKASLLIGWTFSLLTGVAEVAMWETAKDLDYTASIIDYDKYCMSPPRRMKQFALTFFLSLYLFPVLLVCGLSTAFFCLLRKRFSKNRGLRAETQLTKAKYRCTNERSSSVVQQLCQQQTQGNRYIKPAITLLALVTVMALCMLPYSLFVVAVEVFCHHCADTDILYNLVLLQFCNACLDPFMYALTQRKIQTFYKGHLKALRKTLTFKSQRIPMYKNSVKETLSPISGKCKMKSEIEMRVYIHHGANSSTTPNLNI